MLTLFHMPVSHFCEKARWALQSKRIPFRLKSLLPGLHAKKARQLTGQTSLPVLKEGGVSIAGSAAIIDYLDEEYPRFPLTPENKAYAEMTHDWEAFADREIGPAVRKVCYAILLDHPDTMLPVFAQGGPWYSKLYLKKAYPHIKSALERAYQINDKTVAESKAILFRAMEKQLAAQDDLKPVVDCGFSRADVALASLWAPFFNPGKFGIEWSNTLPDEFHTLEEEYSAIAPWVKHMYSKYR